MLLDRLMRSPLSDLAQGTCFRSVQRDGDDAGDAALRFRPEPVRRVVLCSGKIYWELLAARRAAGPSGPASGVALVRVEHVRDRASLSSCEQLNRAVPFRMHVYACCILV